MNKYIALMVGTVLALATAVIATSLPASSEGTSESNYQAKLRAMGVPEGVEIFSIRGREDGSLFDIRYRDSDGNVHIIAPLVAPRETPRPSK
jgi:hypothetical protein